MKLKDISRTATFVWDQSSSSAPLIATGAVAGALDESFSDESQLEIWAPDFSEGQSMQLGGKGHAAAGSINVASRFNRLAWSAPSNDHGRGVLAAGMETGEINVFDPEKIMNGASVDVARIFSNNKHTGPVRGLDFNPIQKNLMLSGAVNAELYIFDLNHPTNAITPGTTSTKLNEITSLQWNPTVSRVFAASSSSGFTSVWDLKAQKEIVSLQYGGGAAKGMDAIGGVAGLQMGKRRGMSDVCWHPEQATRLITASEDDESPIIMLWDLRNTRAPERILSGHHKGVLSVAWCKQDADLLISCGKDNRTLCWNPQTGEIIGELPTSSDWSFQTSWCPRNPDLLATASFDGHIGIHSLQTTQAQEQKPQTFSENVTADDVFGALGQDTVDQATNVLSLRQPPKWLRRPVSATFGFGGLLATTSNLPGANGKHQSGVVHLHKVSTEQDIITRATALHETQGEKEKLQEFCEETVKAKANPAWQTLQTLFKANSRDELVQLLGFSKSEVIKQVQEAIMQLSSLTPDDTADKRETSVTFAEPEKETVTEAEEKDVETPTSAVPAAEATPSELSAASESTKRTEMTEMTDHSLFEDLAPGTPGAVATDFFSSMAAGTLRNPQLDNIVPHKPEVAESSVAATVGSRASSVRSEVTKENTFHIYPAGENDIDRLITQALVIGDFSCAVDLCLASERFADALLLAVRGGPELLQSTQKAYFARRTTSLPFLRVFQSIVTEDLTDIVQNADLGEWKVIFVVLCTFAKDSDFNNLAEQLGQRLQFRWQMLAGSDSPESKASAKTSREDATLCYLAARRLEKVVSIWIDEMQDEEVSSTASKYTAHAQALQSFIEKVAVFTAATGYVDHDLAIPIEFVTAAEAGARTYKLAGLYDRFYEYADLLATQGLVEVAAKYVGMTPADYTGTGAAGRELDKARDRLLRAADVTQASGSTRTDIPAERKPQTQSLTNPYAGGASAYGAPSFSTAAPRQTASQPQVSSMQPAPQQMHPPQSYTTNASNPYAPLQSYQPSSGYDNSGGFPQTQSQGYGAPSQSQPQGYGAPQHQNYGAPAPTYGSSPAPISLGPPPRGSNANGSNANATPPIPAALRRDIPGWNDVPSLVPPKRPQSAMKDASKPAPITSPFPMSMSAEPALHNGAPGLRHGMTPPPPSRSAQPGMLPPPPKGGPRPPSAQMVARAAMPSQQSISQEHHLQPGVGVPPRAHPGRGGPPPPGVVAGPPPRALSPLGPHGRVAAPLVDQLRSPPQTASHAPSALSMPPRGEAPQGLPHSAARLAGPSPPGRRSSVTQNAHPDTPAQTATPTPPPPATKPRHPAGDRSHIATDCKPIYDTLSAELNRVKQLSLPPHLKRIVDDTERRLNILFDNLNNDSITDPAMEQLQNITKAIAAHDANAALAMHVQLVTEATGDMSAWTPGIKQLIRLGV